MFRFFNTKKMSKESVIKIENCVLNAKITYLEYKNGNKNITALEANKALGYISGICDTLENMGKLLFPARTEFNYIITGKMENQTEKEQLSFEKEVENNESRNYPSDRENVSRRY